MLLNQNLRVAQLLDMVWCAARLFHALLRESTCSSTSGLVLECSQAVSCVVK